MTATVLGVAFGSSKGVSYHPNGGVLFIGCNSID